MCDVLMPDRSDYDGYYFREYYISPLPGFTGIRLYVDSAYFSG
jgi:hypothetical protein